MDAAFQARKAPKRVFLAATAVIFFCTLSAADSIGFVPDYIDSAPPAASAAGGAVALSSLPQLGVASDAGAAEGKLPARIEIPAIGLDLPVQNPDTRDVNALDSLLQNGPARYADSAKLGQSGTMIIFAHSSHLPIVHNKMFQAFNQIPDLKPGDTIQLFAADGGAYLYRVDGVARADVNDGTAIPLAPGGATKLTLVTCDTLTGKSARFVLTADFVGTL